MPNPFQRLWRVLQGKFATSLDRLEDPRDQLALFVEELNAQVADLRKAVAVPLAQEKRLKQQIEDLLLKAGEWENRALLALEQGDEELARQALIKKEELEQSTLELQQEWESQKAATRKLQDALQATRKRVDEAKRKYSLMVARHKSAVAQKKIADLTAADSEDSPLQMMERLNEKILRIEAETATNLELSEESLGDDLESKFLELERRKRGENALAQMRASLAEGKRLGKPEKPDTASRVAELKAKLDED